jgi:ubiquitin C-terminal hydrolase
MTPRPMASSKLANRSLSGLSWRFNRILLHLLRGKHHSLQSINSLVVSALINLGIIFVISSVSEVLYHHGVSASGGHYTLDVLHPSYDPSSKPREMWMRIDDEFVSDVKAEDVFGGVDRDDRCAYLLFYRRISGPIAISRT